MKRSSPLWLNEVLTSRFRTVLVVLAVLIGLIAVILVARSVVGFVGSIRHSYHRANDMSRDVGTALPSLRIR